MVTLRIAQMVCLVLLYGSLCRHSHQGDVDPRRSEACRSIYLQRRGALSAAKRWQEGVLQNAWKMASARDWRMVRTIEDCRGGALPRSSLVHRLASRAVLNGTILEYAMVRKAASKGTQVVLRELQCVAEMEMKGASNQVRRIFVFTVVRHPYTRLKSAYQEIGRRLQRGACSTANPPPICRLTFVQVAPRDEPRRFEAFVDEVLDDRLSDYAEYRRDGISYHMESSMSRIASLGRELNEIIRIESYERDMKAMISRFADLQAVFRQSPRLESALMRDVEAVRYDEGLQRSLKFSTLSQRTQERIYEYYKQDFVCLNYSVDVMGEPQWHRDTSMTAAEVPHLGQRYPGKTALHSSCTVARRP